MGYDKNGSSLNMHTSPPAPPHVHVYAPSIHNNAVTAVFFLNFEFYATVWCSSEMCAL